MKLRNRLVGVLVAMMITNSIPVTILAASTNGFNKTISMIEDQVITTGAALTLNFDIKDMITNNSRVFFIYAEDFQFVDQNGNTLTNNVFTTDGINFPTGFENIEVLSQTEMKVTLNAGGATTIKLPIAGKARRGNPGIVVDGVGSVVSSGKYHFVEEVAVKDKLMFSSSEYYRLEEGEHLLGEFKIEEVVGNVLSQGEHVFEFNLSNDEWDFIDGEVEIVGGRGLYGADFHGKIEDNKLIIHRTDEANLTEVLRGNISINGIKIKSNTDKVTNGVLKLNVTHPSLKDTLIELATVSSKHSPIKLNVQDEKIFELNGATQSSRIYFTSDRIELPNELKVNINGGIIHDYYVTGDYESVKTFNNEIILTKNSNSDRGLAIDMQIQGSKVGELTVSATSPQIDGTLNGIIGEVVKLPTSSSSCNCSGSSTTIIEKTIEEKIDEAIIEKIIEEKLNELIESYEIKENEVKTKEYHEFTDVDEDDWYYESVKKAYKLGLITGYDDETFRPYESVSRAELITVIVRLLELNNKIWVEIVMCTMSYLYQHTTP